jgi:hypothetical protein
VGDSDVYLKQRFEPDDQKRQWKYYSYLGLYKGPKCMHDHERIEHAAGNRRVDR